MNLPILSHSQAAKSFIYLEFTLISQHSLVLLQYKILDHPEVKVQATQSSSSLFLYRYSHLTTDPSLMCLLFHFFGLDPVLFSKLSQEPLNFLSLGLLSNPSSTLPTFMKSDIIILVCSWLKPFTAFLSSTWFTNAFMGWALFFSCNFPDIPLSCFAAHWDWFLY